MPKNPYIPSVQKSPSKFIDHPKSKGILDDYAVRKNIATKEGTIEHTPSQDNHIVNKEYCDNNLDNIRVRFMVSGGRAGSLTGTVYMEVGSGLMGAGEGIVMTREGSIVGVSGVATMLIPSEGVNGFFQIRKNGTVVFQVSFNNTTEGIVTARSTQPTLTDTFVAGDVISLTCDCGDATISNVLISAELEYGYT